MNRVGKKFFMTIVSAVLLLGLLAGCSSSSSGKGSGGSVVVWNDVSGDAKDAIDKMVDRFNKANSDITVKSQYFETNPYKQKLHIVMGADNAPDIFSNWGGGGLKDYIDAGDVLDLTPYLKDDSDKYLSSIMKSVTFDGKIYGVPHGNLQQVNFFYNKEIFKKYNLNPPKTWDDLLDAVKVLKSKGIAPIALGGKDKWPDLMYFEYLVDRIGGSEPFNNVAAGKDNAWSDPSIQKAIQMMQQLVKAGAFEQGFSSVGSGDGEDAALLYTGKAAMWLMGSWGYTSVLSDAKDFVDKGNLGWFTFPTVSGGKGDPSDVAGNPSEFYSISKNTKNKKAAIKFLKDANLNDKNVSDLIKISNVPAVNGIDSQLKDSDNGDYMSFSYDIIKNAKYFQQSWDTALSTKEGNRLNEDLSKVLLNQMSPQEFSTDMNKYLK
ncbi:sugar ABC transporter substrate-binding protein [Pullulanibacillus camelliae]|uniref:Sugar ABC transporter substrate-binding protein n=1 Tax=Pullulanibacillus camelliae TaxID=1707096 RepID=A0A8J2VJD7_9BACL|nr:extracellular solute-binding protein [Pullulanibacillus camelliae]GGE25668.1 sugar ABC transporter substrate-binding protein [Pullulanibacillus camelliae]